MAMICKYAAVECVIHMKRERERETDRHRDRETGRDTDRQTDRDIGRGIDRQTDSVSLKTSFL